MDCKSIAIDYSGDTDVFVSFEEYHLGKGIGAFHLIHSINDRHIMDVNDMQKHMSRVRCAVADIVKMLLEKGNEMFANGLCNTSRTVAKFEQISSMHEDDRLIVNKNIFDETSYDPNDPINAEDTIDYTDMFSNSEEFQNELVKVNAGRHDADC